MKAKLLKSLLITFLMMQSITVFSHNDKHEEAANPLFTGLSTEAAKVVQQFHQALKSKDDKAVLSLLSEDVLIYESGQAERSATEYAGGHMHADMNYLDTISSELIEHQVNVNGDIAISTSRSKNTKEVAGRQTEKNTSETIVVTKINGKWLITHIHWS